MAIIDFDYYSGTYRGSTVSADIFDVLEDRSEDVINSITRMALLKFDTFEQWQKEYIKKAVASQVEYFNNYGLSVGFSQENVGFTVGKVSVSAKDNKANNYADSVSKRTLMYLEMARIIERGCGWVC